MGNNGSHTPGQGGPGATLLVPPPNRQPLHWQHSLPTDTHLKASHLKVLPDLDQNPRLRSTNNGAILQSGGTISGRRPLPSSSGHESDPNGNLPNGVYRSKSITQESYEERVHQPRFSYLSNQRDPLHRSHTHLHMDDPQDSFMMQSKRFGSEPDLRNNLENQMPSKNNKAKNFKKKYKAPPPPHTQGSSSPDSSPSWNCPQSYEHQVPQAPSRKLRLFKTRAETKKNNNKHNHDVKSNGYVHAGPTHEFSRSYEVEESRYHPNDIFEQSRYEEREKLFRSPSRDREEYLQYPSSRDEDMIQSHSSLKREEKILQTAFNRQEVLRTKHSQQNMYREKARQAQESKFDSNKEFRNSERFKKQNNDPSALRREKSFDNSLVQEIERKNGVNRMYNERKMLLDSQNKFNNRDDSNIDYRYKEKETTINDAINKRKSVPNMPQANGISDFQEELKMATRKLRQTNRNTPDKSDTEKKNNLNKTVVKKETVNKSAIDNKNQRNINNTSDIKAKPIENKTNSPRITSTQLKSSNLTTLDRSKHIKPKVIKAEKKEEIKSTQKINSTKVLPVDNKVNNKENKLRNRRESRVMADRGQASGKESTPEQSPSRIKPEIEKERNQSGQPSKSFYFGMDKSQVPVTDEELDAHEKVRRHLEMSYEFSPPAYNNEVEDLIHITPKIDYNARLDLPQASSESALSSEPEPEDLMSEENNPHGIALQLRPTLPKKQLEIPRFSPAAAWRQLASLEIEESFTTVPPPMPNLPVQTEEKIRRQSQPHRWARPERGSHDKSGDSGISGDAGPNHEDCIDVAPHSPVVARREEMHKRPLLSAWTPQQDLEEESSSDPGNESPHSANTDNAPAKFSARQQVFSLSLPRESHIAHNGEKNKQFQQPFNSLQKLKKSVSGAIGVALGSKKVEEPDDNSGNEQTESNWFLSRSAPNSLNNALNTTNPPKLSTAKSNDSGQQQTPPSSDQEDDRMPPVVPGMMRQQPPFSYLATGGHVMYLPRGDPQNPQEAQQQQHNQQPYSMAYGTKERTRDTEQKSDGEMDDERYKAFKDGRLMSRSKSSGEIILSPRNAVSKPRPKGKRFTFQSTVRQIERKRLAEKLSKEAESKERQRLSELEAMRRVEEEFQRKRAREKASIRQQLRLVSLDESCSSLPSSWNGQGRTEPEGAVSPSPPPASRGSGGSGSGGGRRISGENSPSSKGASPSPKIGRSRITNGKANEYREPREYKDYRRAPSTPVLPPAVHPPACYNMPRVGRAPIGSWEADPDNYRREFARGRRPPSSSGSDLSQGGRLLTPPRAC